MESSARTDEFVEFSVTKQHCVLTLINDLMRWSSHELYLTRKNGSHQKLTPPHADGKSVAAFS